MNDHGLRLMGVILSLTLWVRQALGIFGGASLLASKEQMGPDLTRDDLRVDDALMFENLVMITPEDAKSLV